MLFKKYLKHPLAILWGAIIVIRTVLDDFLLRRPQTGSWFDLVSATFALTASVAEFGIFYRAYRAYSNSEIHEPAGRFGISSKILLPLFFFCLPYALWINRRSIIELASIAPGERWIALAGLAAACGFNLYLSGFMVHSMLAARSIAKQLV